MTDPAFDIAKAHQYFSADCFNRTWGFIDKADRTPEEAEQMLLLALASLWHWTQREDRTDQNLSVGYWLVSRAQALCGRGEEARRYGQLALEAAQQGDADAFTSGYAYEALARAASISGTSDKMGEYLLLARKAADQVGDEESKSWLLDDLKTIA